MSQVKEDSFKSIKDYDKSTDFGHLDLWIWSEGIYYLAVVVRFMFTGFKGSLYTDGWQIKPMKWLY